MKARLKSCIVLLVLVLPTMVLLAGYIHEYRLIARLPDVIIPITGYDPRDPVRGHYLQFQYDWKLESGVAHATCDYQNAKECALCIRRDERHDTVRVHVMRHTDHQICDAVLSNVIYNPKTSDRPQFTDFNQNVRRFYVPEQGGPKLDEIFRSGKRQFSVRAKIAPGNRIIVHDLLIDGRPYRDALQ